MKAEEYFKMVETFDSFIDLLDKDLNPRQHNALDSNKIDKQDLLYGLCGIVPEKYFLSNNGYHKAQDKKAYKEKCIKYVKSRLEHYKDYVGKHLKTQFATIVDGLCNGSLTFGQTRMIVPNYMKTNFEENWTTYKDGKAIVIEILNYWKELIVTREWKEEFKSYTPIVETRRLDIPLYTGSTRSFYDDDPNYEPEVVQIDDGEDYLFDNDYERNERPIFDEDGSNWAYKERHD